MRYQTDWKEGYVIKLLKKGVLKECKNWRGILERHHAVINCWKSVEQDNPGGTESRGG